MLTCLTVRGDALLRIYFLDGLLHCRSNQMKSGLFPFPPAVQAAHLVYFPCRFFCLSVFITMYLNDHQRAEFYGSLGLDTTVFNQHVIIETNKSAARVFPAVPDVENPEFFKKMDLLVKYNGQLAGIGKFPVSSGAGIPGRAASWVASGGTVRCCSRSKSSAGIRRGRRRCTLHKAWEHRLPGCAMH